jgi:hypothetical protein
MIWIHSQGNHIWNADLPLKERAETKSTLKGAKKSTVKYCEVLQPHLWGFCSQPAPLGAGLITYSFSNAIALGSFVRLTKVLCSYVMMS